MYSFIIITALLPFLAAAATPCTVGNDTPCFPSSTCTPTMISASGKPWLGQCIATPTPQVPASSPPILSYPPVSMPTPIEPPPASMPSAVSFPPVSMPTPVSMECNVGAGTGCSTGSTCTPTQTCYRLRPCGGKCVATATPQLPATSAPVMSYPPISMPTPVAECMVGWADNGCAVGTTCEPIETCHRLRPCKGKCMAASKTPLPSYPPVSMPSPISYSPVPMPTPVNPDCSSAPAVSHPPVSKPSPISVPPMPMPTPVDPECSYSPVSMPSSISVPPKPMPTPKEPDCSSAPIISHPPVSMPSPISIPPVSMPSAQPPAECMVGWADTGCKSDFSCEPVETCYRLRPCRGKCVAKVTSSPVLSYPMPTATFAPSSMVTCYRG